MVLSVDWEPALRNGNRKKWWWPIYKLYNDTLCLAGALIIHTRVPAEIRVGCLPPTRWDSIIRNLFTCNWQKQYVLMSYWFLLSRTPALRFYLSFRPPVSSTHCQGNQENTQGLSLRCQIKTKTGGTAPTPSLPYGKQKAQVKSH
jgi:hypothetical protein